jgi:MinD superfamily P-loop ATPase
MRIAVASGKGGTGKTTVATQLARVGARSSRRVAYLDCDVEEPNGAIFLKPSFERDDPVHAAVPEVDLAKCIGCGQCGQICQYSAIVSLNQTVLTFPELCHGCAGCWRVCPSGAITEGTREIGRLQTGEAGGVMFCQGLLNVGQAMSPPVIRAVKSVPLDADMVVLDCPPGTSCPVIESLRGSDFILLVTEPTPFGLHDLKLAVETVRRLGIDFGVVVNRAGVGDGSTSDYCRDEGIEILAEIPDDRRVAEAYARGQLGVEASPEAGSAFDGLVERLADCVGLEASE